MKKWLSSDRLRRIEILAIIIAAVHVVLLLQKGNTDATVPVTWDYLVKNPLTGGLEQASAPLYDLPLTWLVVGALVAYGLLLAAKLTILKARVQADEKNKISRFRWVELAVVGGGLSIATALLTGVRGMGSLKVIALSSLIIAVVGRTLEQARADRKRMSRPMLLVLAASFGMILFTLLETTIGSLYYKAGLPVEVYLATVVAVLYWVGGVLLAAASFKAHKPKASASLRTALAHRVLSLMALALYSWVILRHVA